MMHSTPPGSMGVSITPKMLASGLYFSPFATSLSYAAAASSADLTFRQTPPASVLCRMSGETIFMAAGALSFFQYSEASAAFVAR